MLKLMTFFLLIHMLATTIRAQALRGAAFREAVNVLLYGLNKLSSNGGRLYRAQNIYSAYRLRYKMGYSYVTVLIDEKYKAHDCLVEISRTTLMDYTIMVKCVDRSDYPRLTYN